MMNHNDEDDIVRPSFFIPESREQLNENDQLNPSMYCSPPVSMNDTESISSRIGAVSHVISQDPEKIALSLCDVREEKNVKNHTIQEETSVESIQDDHSNNPAVFTGTHVESRLQSDGLISDNSQSPSPETGVDSSYRSPGGAKSRFRAARNVVPGAFALTPGNRNDSDEVSINSDIGADELEDDEFESHAAGTSDPNSSILPSIVTAEIVEEGNALDQSERERIVKETIESMSKQAVSAELVPDENNKSARKYRVIVLAAAFILIAIVVVAVLTTRSPDSTLVTNAPTRSPTLSPTPFVDDSAFYTIDELYEAVDAYHSFLRMGNNESSSVETSEVALRYGYPISTWNVSLLTNFSYVFE